MRDRCKGCRPGYEAASSGYEAADQPRAVLTSREPKLTTRAPACPRVGWPRPHAHALTTDDLRVLLESWCLDLAASRRTPNTLRQYGESVLMYPDWCDRQSTGDPVLGRDSVRCYQVELLELGRAPSTVLARQAGVKRFSRYLAREGEIDRDDLAGLPQPQLQTSVPVVLSDDQVRALIATCDKVVVLRPS